MEDPHNIPLIILLAARLSETLSMRHKENYDRDDRGGGGGGGGGRRGEEEGETV